MSKESYVNGFCKAAAARGVDPQALAKFAQAMFDPQTGRYRQMTPIENSLSSESPVPQAEIGVSLKDTAKARSERLARIRDTAKKMELGEVNPSMSDLSGFFEYVQRNGNNPSYRAGLADSVPDVWKDYMPQPGAPYKAVFSNADVHTMPKTLGKVMQGYDVLRDPVDAAMLRALYSGHTNLLERISKEEYPPVK